MSVVPAEARVSRRFALRSGVVAAGAVLGGAALSACGASNRAPTATRAAAAVYTLLWRPWYNFSGATSATGHELLMQGIQPWLDKHRGVQVNITYMGYHQPTVTAILAGTGPDVFADWVLPIYLAQHLLLDLTKYVQEDNVDLGIFPALDMDLFRQGGVLWALPSYLHLQAPAVNLGLLDQLALQYPDPSWTYAQWGALMAQLTNKSSDPKKQRRGGWFNWGGYDYWGGAPARYYLKGFGGEYVDPGNPAKSYLSSSGTEQCLSWIAGLLADGVAGTGPLDFVTGQQAITWMNTAGGLIPIAQNGGALKWQLYDEMVFPRGRVAFAASDFYAVSAATKNPDIAWSFMKYLTVESDWQKWMVHLALNGPNQKQLYPFWEETVKQVATRLADIDLNVFTRQMVENQPYFGLLYKYQDQASGQTIKADLAPVWNNPQGVAAACRQAAAQVDALQAQGAQEARTSPTLTLTQERRQYAAQHAAEVQGLADMFSSGPA